MAADLKLEILYYRTASDFEMEFNLCGCCSMRMLTDKPNEKKELLNSLLTSVNRSRVTVVVGELYSEEGIINVVSKAIGKKLSDAQKNLYTVPEHCDSLLPAGCIPLVSDKGALVGCIIESGPQAIILLTNDRVLRHSVLKSTLYDYLKLLSHNSGPADIASSLYRGKHSAPQEEIKPEQLSETLKEEETHIPLNHAITPKELGENIIMSSSVVKPVFDDDDDDTYYEPVKRKKKVYGVLSAFICIFASILLFAAGCAGYYFVYEPLAAEKLYEELEKENAYSLEDMNSDFFAVLSSPVIGINYPVVFNDSSNYYSSHLFNGKVNRFGTPYTLSVKKAENIVIHGFSDNGGFGAFTDYFDKKSNGIISTAPRLCLQTTKSSEYYAIFSVFDATDISFDYLRSNFIDKTEKEEFINTACGFDVSGAEITPEVDDMLLTVVCEEKNRTIVIIASKSEE